LLDCLSNGDNDVQKAALAALFTWKKPAIRPYETNLTNLLDASRFSDELYIFIQGGTKSTVQDIHRKDLMPLILRLLYGKLVSRNGAHSNHGGQETRRKAVFRSLDGLEDEEFAAFIRIAFGSLSDLHLVVEGKAVEQCLAYEFLGIRKQFGLLRMVATMIEELGNRLMPFADQFMNAVLYCVIRASRGLAKDQNDASAPDRLHMAMTRNVRQAGIQCLELLFSNFSEVDFSAYLPLIFTDLINPRLERFATETSQSVSGLLQLFGTWASNPRTTLYLVDVNNVLIRQILDCLNAKAVQQDVQLFVLNRVLKEVIHSAAQGSSEHSEDPIRSKICSRVVVPNVEHTLTVIAQLLKRTPSRLVTDSAVQVLSDISSFVSSSIELETLISTLVFVIQQPLERVSPKSKGGLMRTLAHILPHAVGADRLLLDVYQVISSSFNFFRDRPNRETLSKVLSVLASKDGGLLEVAELCADLNSFSNHQVDEVDFDRRLNAFAKLNETSWSEFSAKQWRPLLFNLLYYVKDEEEMAIRSSASFGLRRFIDRAREATDQETEFQGLVIQILLHALQNGMSHKAELVRMEFVAVLGYLVKSFPDFSALSDLHRLLVNDDEEASFFNNILHIQQHRRLRALRRLANEARSGHIKSKNVSNIFLPLIERFVFDSVEAEDGYNLTSEAISTIGMLGDSLEWTQFRAVFRRYRGLMEIKSSTDKPIIRLLGHFADSLGRASNSHKVLSELDKQVIDHEHCGEHFSSALSRTLPSDDALAIELVTNFLPFLTGFIHNKDESEISLRVPVAVTTVKLLKLLPEDQVNQFLPPVLLDVSSILRSKVQESRDIARRTLAEITMLLGPQYFGFILRELRSALPRGAQLHILSFTLHSLLVVTADTFKTGDLDYCLSAIVSIVVDDVFGLIGQEKDAEGYTSKMKEVRSNKSYDSMELLAKHATIAHLHHLVLPLQAILKDKLNSKLIKKIEELLRRIGVGILRNQSADSRELLKFCYELMNESHDSSVSPPWPAGKAEAVANRFLVQASSESLGVNRASATSYDFKLTKFSLDVLRSVFIKHDSLLTAENVSGFLPLIGDALLQPQEEVKISALRLISTLIRIPLPAIDRNTSTYIAEAMKMVKNAPDTSHESAQAALKVITATIRERKSVEVREADLSYLLNRLKADLEEPDRQGVTFNFVKALMSRKIVVPEVYDLMDTVAAMMVTNNNRAARDLARGVYFQFLMHYPQGKNRWSKQLGFLIKNMSYEHQEGRKSVLEAVHLLLSKVGDNVVQEVVGTVFVPLLIVVANDDSTECREMGAALVGEVYTRADTEHIQSFISLLRDWMERDENPSLQVLALQAYRIFFDAKGSDGENEASYARQKIHSIVESDAKHSFGGNWEATYFALQLFAKVSKLFPQSTLTISCAPTWAIVWSCLTYPHAWVKSSAANLVGVYLADLAKANSQSGYESLPLLGSAHLPFGADAMLEVTKASLRVLGTPSISEELATQCVRNLAFLGRCVAANGLKVDTSSLTIEDASDGDEEEESPEERVKNAESQRTGLQYIFERLSSILRKEPLTTRAPSLVPKTAALHLVTSLCTHLDQASLQPSLPTIFLPLLILTDPSIPTPRSTDDEFRAAQKSLGTSSQEILDLLQKKVGTTEFVRQVAGVNEDIKKRRESRRIKRRIEVVTDPEKAGRDKKRKNERLKERRKELGAEQRSRRHGW
jgi:U3 small nucleolar RNA-associated protein 20